MASCHLFTYGTLMFPEIMEAVAGGRFDCSRAVLPGYARYAIRGESYPGLAAEAGRETQGVVYFGVGPIHLARLDRFEGDWYERRTVTLRLEDRDAVEAWVYVLAQGHRNRLLTESWDPRRFAEVHLPAFVAYYGGFRRL